MNLVNSFALLCLSWVRRLSFHNTRVVPDILKRFSVGTKISQRSRKRKEKHGGRSLFNVNFILGNI